MGVASPYRCVKGAVVVAFLAAAVFLFVPSAAWADWTVIRPDLRVVGFANTGLGHSTTETVSYYTSGSLPTAAQYANGSFDETVTGSTFAGGVPNTITVSPDCNYFEIQTVTSSCYLFYFPSMGDSLFIGQGGVAAQNVRLLNAAGTVVSTLPVSVVNTPMPVSGTLTATVASASIAGTLPVSLPASYDVGLGFFLFMAGLALAFVLSGGVSWLRM